MHHLKESEITSWRGIAFEEVCLQHVDQIKHTLQIAGVSSRESSFILHGDDGGEGMQIHPTLVSAAPVHRNEYSDIFLSQITIDDLFI